MNASAQEIIGIKERLTINLSSHQYISILDSLLSSALEPIFLHTHAYKAWVSELVTYVAVHGRRKLSNVEHNKQLDLLVTCLIGKSSSSRFKAWTSMHLDRGITFFYLFKLCDLAREYQRNQAFLLQFRSLKTKQQGTAQNQEKYASVCASLASIEALFRADSRYLSSLLACCAWYTEQANTFKSMLAEKYYRFAYQECYKMFYGSTMVISLPDLYRNYLLAINHAIDKYDPTRGVLTQYMRFWFSNAANNPNFSHQFEVAYSLPSTRRRLLQKKNWVNTSGQLEQNSSQPIDIESQDLLVTHIEEKSASADIVNKLKYLARDRDIKIALMLSGIDYPLDTNTNTIKSL